MPMLSKRARAPHVRSSAAPRAAAIVLALMLTPMPAAAGPVLAGVELRQVKPPPTVLEGVATIEVAQISGPGGQRVREELIATLADPEREVGEGTLSDKAGSLVEAGVGIGAAMLASKVPGIGGKLVKGATEVAGGMVADKVRAEKIVLNDGLRIDVHTVKASGADAKLKIGLKSGSSDRSYTEKVPLKDDKGNEVKDANGATVMTERSCTERSATLDLSWSLERKAGPLTGSLPTRATQAVRCSKEDGELPAPDAMIAGLAGGLGTALGKQIAPSWTALRVPMRRSGLTRSAIDQIDAGQLDVGRCMLQRTAELESTVTGVDADVWLDLGATLEAQGHLQASLEAYQGAVTRKSGLKPASEAVLRVERRTAEVATLERAYGLKYAPPPLAECPALPDGTPTLAKKGGPLLTSAGGEKSGRDVEKGELVFVRTGDGKFTEVATVDGVVGHIAAKQLP